MSETQLAERPHRAPVLAGDRGVKFSSLEDLWRFATAVVNSGIYKDVSTPEIAVVKIQAGLELGLTPVWALSNVLVISGRCCVWGDSLLGLVQSHPQCEDVIETIAGEELKMVATCEVHRKGRVPIKRSFSVRDAKRAGLWGKTGPWSTYPQRMLAMRARSWACRDAFADALRGLGVVEEYRDVEPKRVEAREIPRPKLVLPDEPILPVPALADQSGLEKSYGPSEAGESDEVGDPMPSEQSGVVGDSPGGQELFHEERDPETGEFII